MPRCSRRRPAAIAVTTWILVLGAAFSAGCSSPEERVAESVAAAEQAVEAGRYRDAIIDYLSALKEDPSNADLNFRMAEVLNRLDQTEDALFYYREAYRLDATRSDARLAEAWLVMAADPALGESLIEESRRYTPGDPLVFIRGSELALIRGDLDTALGQALTAIELGPRDLNSRLQKAVVEMARIREKQILRQPVPKEFYENVLADLDVALSDQVDPRPAWLSRIYFERARLFFSWPERQEEVPENLRRALDLAIEHNMEWESILELASRFANQAKDRELAQWVIEQRVALKPDDMNYWRLYAEFVDDANQPTSSVLDKLVDERGDEARVQLLWASDRARRGHRDDALQRLWEVAPGVDEPAAIYFGLVDLELAAGNRERAEKAFAALQENEPQESYRTYMVRGLLDRVSGRHEEALEAFSRAIDHRATGRAFRLRAQTELQLGDATRATRTIDQGLGMLSLPKAERAGLLLLKAKVASLRGDDKQVIEILQRLVRADVPLAPSHYPTLAAALFRDGRTEDALALVEGSLGAIEGPTLLLTDLDLAEVAVRHAGPTQPDRVAAAIEALLERFPANPRLLRAIVYLDRVRGQPERAVARLESVIQVAPKRVAPLILLANLKLAAGDPGAAVELSRRAEVLAPNNPTVPKLLAVALRASGKVEEAKQSLLDRQERGELSVPNKRLLASFHLESGETAEAVALLDELVKGPDASVSDKNDLAFALATQGKDLTRATALAEEARAGAPNRSEVADTLGFVYLKAGLVEAALVQFDEAARLARASSAAWELAQLHRGMALVQLGRPEEARPILEAVTAAKGAHSDAAQKLLVDLEAS